MLLLYQMVVRIFLFPLAKLDRAENGWSVLAGVVVFFPLVKLERSQDC